MTSIFALYARFSKQQSSGSVLIDERGAPGIGGLSGALNRPSFLVRNPQIEFDGPLGLLALSMDYVYETSIGNNEFLFALKRRLEHSGRNVKVRRMGRQSGMLVDDQFYPFLTLIKARRALQKQAAAKLRTATKKGRGNVDASFLRKQPLVLELKGEFGDTGYPLKASFWNDRGVQRYRITVKLPDTADAYLLNGIDHDPLRDLIYRRPVVILSSENSPAGTNAMAILKGLFFYSEFQFGQNLQSGVVKRTPQVLTGTYNFAGTNKLPLFRLTSSPFQLEFGGVKFRNANLSITGEYDSVYDYRQYMAGLRGVWDAGPLQLDMQTQLPRDTEVLSWNTLANPAFDEDGKLTFLGRPQDNQFVTTLSGMNQLSAVMGGDMKWLQSPPRLAHMVQTANPTHLLAAHVDVNLLTKRPDSVRVDVWAEVLRDNDFQNRLYFAPLVFTFSMIHPFGGGDKSVLTNVYGTLWLGEVAFDGHFRPPQMTFRGVARDTNVQAVCGVLGILVPQQLAFTGVRALTVEVNVFDRTLSVKAKTMRHDVPEVILR